MAVRRQKNWLGQQRVDTTHLREVESAVASDFDDLAGQILASRRPLVVSGMTIAMNAAVGGFANQLVLKTASSILLHATASEPGALFVVPSTQPDETLNSQNAKIVGSFTPNSVNYIGIDLVRLADPTTADIVKFRSATTKKEFSQSVPLARTLQYRIVISTSDFSVLTNVAPVAKVTLDANGVVQDVTDCREMLFRLGTGGSTPNPLGVFTWPGARTENPVTSSSTTDPFVGADKSIASFLDFFHAMESRLWEVGGGEHWYSPTTDRDVLFIRNITNALPQGDNFYWTGSNLRWRGISFSFGNSTAATNLIADQTSDQAGLTDLGVGQALYVDVDRAQDGVTLTMHKASLTNLGTPTVPGSRQLIAWRTAEGVFARGSPYPVNYAIAHATATVYGVVRLFANVDTDATVAPVDSGGIVRSYGISRNTSGTLAVGQSVLDTQVDIATTGVLTRILGSLSVLQNLSITGKATSAATVNGDPSTTLITKGWAEDAFVHIDPGSGVAFARGITNSSGGSVGLVFIGPNDVGVQIGRAGIPVDIYGNLQVAGSTTFYTKPTAPATVNADAATTLTTKGWTEGRFLRNDKFRLMSYDENGNLISSVGSLPYTSAKGPTGITRFTCIGWNGAAIATWMNNSESYPANDDCIISVVRTGTTTFSVQIWDADGGARDRAFSIFFAAP